MKTLVLGMGNPILTSALALGRGLKMLLPDDDDFQIVAIEVEDALTFGAQCTPAVAAAIPCTEQEVLTMLEEKAN